MPEVSKRMQFFTDSPIARMSILSDKYGAINLSAGFPEFSPPAPILNSLKDIVDRGPHQYSLDAGSESFRQALADYRLHSRDINLMQNMKSLQLAEERKH